jgi:hypothetical protein
MQDEKIAQEQSAPAESSQKKDWHAQASFQLKFVFLVIGVAMFVAWMLWMQFYA